jgi:hypothetical protein
MPMAQRFCRSSYCAWRRRYVAQRMRNGFGGNSYSPSVTPAATRALIQHLANHLTGGDRTALIHHALHELAKKAPPIGGSAAVKILAMAVGAAILVTTAHVTILATGGYGGSHAYITLAVAGAAEGPP